VGFRKESTQSFIHLLKEGQAFVHEPESKQSKKDISLGKNDNNNLPIIIHISDIHFGSKIKDGKEVDMHRFYEGENSQSLSAHLIEELTSESSRYKDKIHRIELVVSGDLAYTASEADFQKALIFLNEVSSGAGIPKRKFHIIPGNHDINWALSKIDNTKRFDNYINFLAKFYGDELFKEKYPKIKWPLYMGDPRPKASEIISLYFDEATNLMIVGFNSCVFENEQHHYGFIGERQLKTAKELMQNTSIQPEVIKIAVIHHHLHPFPEILNPRNEQEVWLDVSTIRDAGHVERYLEKMGFDLVLHGHKHKPQVRETLVRDADPTNLKKESRPLIVCGAGSISCIELEHNESNQYEILELQRSYRYIGAEFVHVEWRSMPLTAGAEWSTIKTWDLLG
ncbi:MAG: metallophosphoesterase, partial [Chitinophagaceae bacterium]